MLFIDLIEQYGNDFTVAYVRMLEDKKFLIYAIVYPCKDKNFYKIAFRIEDKQTNEKLIYSNKYIFVDLNYLSEHVVLDFH